MKIGFIGFGSMGRAIAEGLLARNVCAPEEIYACAGHFDKVKEIANQLGIHAAETAAEVAKSADIVIPAVVPGILEAVLRPVLPILQKKLVVSIVSGWDFARYEAFLAPGTHHISTTPNTPIAIGEGVLACESTHNLTEAEYAQFCDMFGKIALIVPVTAAQFGPAGTLGGCTPAFAAMFLEALGDAGVKYGLSRAAAACGLNLFFFVGDERPLHDLAFILRQKRAEHRAACVLPLTARALVADGDDRCGISH